MIEMRIPRTGSGPRRVGRLASVLLASALVAAVGSLGHSRPAHAAGVNGCATVALLSTASGTYVSTEIQDSNFPGMLRARASSVGSWEKYTLCVDEATSTGTLLSHANGLYVAAERDYMGRYAGMLRARTSPGNLGTWEQFKVAVPCCDTWNFTAHSNGLLVSAEFGYAGTETGMLRARATSAGPWEAFYAPYQPQ
jgi:hypothetical protein